MKTSRSTNRSTTLRRNFIYSWVLRAILSGIITLSWIGCLTFTLANYSLSTLPFLFLLQAAFTITGMLIFSTVTEKYTVKQLLAVATVGAIITSLFLAVIGFENNITFILLLCCSGLFLPQVELLFSHLLEYYFTSHDALKVLPWLESAETSGSVIGGIIAAGIGTAFKSLNALWVVIFLLFMVFVFGSKKFSKMHFASTPLDDRHIGKQKNLNAFFKAVKNTQKKPLLQIFLFCVAFNALLFQLIEFQYAQIVYNEVFHSGSNHPSIQGLLEAFGLISLAIYGFTLILQCFFASGLLKKLGIRGGFLVHSLTTLLGSIGLFLIPAQAGVLLIRNNFEMTTALRKNSYEMAYYRFEDGSQRSLRELYEAFITPSITILATFFMIGLQWLLIPQHVSIILRLFILFAAFGMSFFSFQLHFSEKIS